MWATPQSTQNGRSNLLLHGTCNPTHRWPKNDEHVMNQFGKPDTWPPDATLPTFRPPSIMATPQSTEASASHRSPWMPNLLRRNTCTPYKSAWHDVVECHGSVLRHQRLPAAVHLPNSRAICKHLDTPCLASGHKELYLRSSPLLPATTLHVAPLSLLLCKQTSTAAEAIKSPTTPTCCRRIIFHRA